MNIGDGLTLQSYTVDGKTTSGIFFLPSNSQKSHSVSQNVKIGGKHNKKVNDEASIKGLDKKVPHKSVNKRTTKSNNSQLSKTRQLTKSPDNEVVFINNNTRVDAETKKSNSSKANPALPDKVKSKNKDPSSVPVRKLMPQQTIHSNNGTNKIQPTTKGKKNMPSEIKVDTNFVTLTQDQLNTILNLVKTKQEIDVATVINNKNKEPKEKDSGGKKSSEGKRVEPTSVPGLSFDEDAQSNETKSESDKENDKSENVTKLLDKVDKPSSAASTKSNNRKSPPENYKNVGTKEIEITPDKQSYSIAELSGTLGGYGSRDREKSRLEEKRKKWVEDLNEQVERKKQLQAAQRKGIREDKTSLSTDLAQTKKSKESSSAVEPRSAPTSASQQRKDTDQTLRSNSSSSVEQIQKTLPSAIRSSFFLGEAIPRDHAFSAKKKKEQQAWKEELEKQIREKEEMKVHSTVESVEPDMWSRHFDTMNPVKMQQGGIEIDGEIERNDSTVASSTQQKQSPRKSAYNSDNVSGIYLGEHSNNPNAARAQSNYLRSMTALLDPSQLDALEVKRQKQLEHRRVIAEQVEEKRRIKEAEMRAKREEEEQEEKRLEEERKQMQNQFEREKSKHQAMEEKRDRQTQELYQQMKEAQATALKEKLEKREKTLKSHGHDTSRLERTHKYVLEKNMPQHHSPPRLHHDTSINLSGVHTSSHHEHIQETPRDSVVYRQGSLSPVTVMASNTQVPIKLEISLNQKQGLADLVARGVQTDSTVQKKASKRNDSLLDILSDSDGDTQYMELPHPKQTGKGNKKKPKGVDRDQEARNRHYERYSRTNRQEENLGGGDKRRRGFEPKPKWGVGEKKKQFVSASNRYVSSKREREEREERLRRREEQLLADQARNQPERLVATRKVKSDVELHDYYNVDVSDNYRSRPRKERSRSPVEAIPPHRGAKPSRNRPVSPPVPALQNQMRPERSFEPVQKIRDIPVQIRPDTAISVTTEQAKYQSSKHTAHSPVPDTDEFVQYRRSDVVLDPNQPQSRPGTEKEERTYSRETFSPKPIQNQQGDRSKDPLLNADMLKQKERQDKILKEISILRQGLLLKQREVASYPVAMTMPHTGRNLPERTNDVSLT